MQTTRQKLADLASGLEVELFATRESISECYQYAEMCIQRLPKEDRAIAYTLLHVVMNSIALRLNNILAEELTDETSTG